MDKKKQSKKIDPDGPLHKWGKPEGVTDYMKKTPGQKKVSEAKYSVDVEGLPRFYMDSDSPAKVKIALRKLLKKASSIDAVSRVPDATIKADLRQRLKTAETDKRYVDEKLDPRMGAGEYVKDFKKSDAPQFKGKSDKKKREMAIAAYLAARQEKAMEEGVDRANSEGRGKGYTFSHEKSAKGYRAHLKNPQGKTSYLGSQSYKKKEHAEGEAKAYHKAYFGHPSIKANDRGATNAVHKYRQDNKQHHAEGYGNPFKAAARSAKYKELSHEYEREKQVRRQKAQKSSSQNKSFGKLRDRMTNESEAYYQMKSAERLAAKDGHDFHKLPEYSSTHNKHKEYYRDKAKNQKEEAMLENAKHKKVAKELQMYAKKRGGGDKDDFLMAAQLIGDGKMRDFKKFLRAMDTDPRDGVIQILHRNGIKEEVMNEIEEGMVNAVSAAKKYAGNVTKAVNKIDKMKSKKQGGDFSDNPRIQKKLRKYNEGMESWNEFLESSCGGSHKSKKKAVKEGYGSKKIKEDELSPAQKKHMDTDKDGDIDAVDMKNLRNKKKS